MTSARPPCSARRRPSSGASASRAGETSRHGPLGRLGDVGERERRGDRREREGEGAGRVEGDEPLVPAARCGRTGGRQRVEELVGERSSGAVAGRSARAACQPAVVLGQPLGLTRAQDGAGLDQVQLARPRGIRRTPRGAERVGHQRAAAGPELDQRGPRAGRPHRSQDCDQGQSPISSPNIWLISGAVTKSPAAPNGSRRRVVAVAAGRPERSGHVAGRRRSGPSLADHAAEPVGRAGSTRRASGPRREAPGQQTASRPAASAATAAGPW